MTSYHERNREQTRRLAALRRLSDDELSRPVREHWTVAVALAHIQYWDGRALAGIEAWKRHGVPLTLWRSDEGRIVNDLRLDLWRALPPREALEGAIVTAEALDRVLAALTQADAETVAAQRRSALERWMHREGHLEEIEQAVAR